MILSLFVYISLLLVALCSSTLVCQNWQLLNRKQYYFLILLPLLFLTFVLGFRENVGTDFEVYKTAYLNADFHFEPLYTFLNLILWRFGANYSWLFVSIVFIQFLFLYKAFKDYPFLLSWGIFFLFTTGLLFSQLNIIRQATAFYIFLYAMRYAVNRQFGKYLLGVCIAGLFHYSLFVFVPLYFFITFDWGIWEVWWVQLLLYILTLVFATILFSSILEWFQSLFLLTKYANYAHRLGEWDVELRSGYGVLFTRIVDGVIIYYASKLSNYYNNFSCYYKLFFIGILLSIVFGQDLVLLRLIFPLLSMRVLILSFLFYYVCKNWKVSSVFFKIIICFIFGGYIGIFLLNIFNGAEKCTPYNFSFI